MVTPPTPPSGEEGGKPGRCSEQPCKRPKFNCLQCKLSKVKCSRTLPSCERCLRLELPCKPQYQMTGRRRRTSRVRHHDPHGGRGGGECLPPASLTLPTTIHRGVAWDYQQCAELMVSAIAGLKARGELHDSRIMSLLRSWAFCNLHHEEDLTWGAYDYVLELMGPYANTIPLESADPNVNPSHPLGDEQGSYLNPACLPPYLTTIDDTMSAITGFIRYDGTWKLFSNPCFSSTFMSIDEMTKCRSASLPEFLWCRVFHPSERWEFIKRLMELMLSTPRVNGEVSLVLLCQERGGSEPVQSLVRVRYVTVHGGMYSAAIMSILRLPQSTPHHTMSCAREDIPPMKMAAEGPPALPFPPALTAPLPSPPSATPPLADAATMAIPPHNLASSSSASSSPSSSLTPSSWTTDNYDQGDAWEARLLFTGGVGAGATSSSMPNTTTFSSQPAHSRRALVPAPTAENNARPSALNLNGGFEEGWAWSAGGGGGGGCLPDNGALGLVVVGPRTTTHDPAHAASCGSTTEEPMTSAEVGLYIRKC